MPLEKCLRNPYVNKSIPISGIVKGFLTTGLFHVEIPDFDSPIGPRIEQALRRYNFETKQSLLWKELGKRVWRTLGRGAVDTSKLSRLKNDQQGMSIAEGGAFAYELDVSPAWLFWGIGEMGRFPRPPAASAEHGGGESGGEGELDLIPPPPRGKPSKRQREG